MKDTDTKITSDSFIKYIQSFNLFNNTTHIEKINGIAYYINEFWTSKQRAGLFLHEISYRACFKPQLPEFFINILTSEGNWVLDPFMGRGTTPLQSVFMHRQAAGSDINPLSLLLTRPRINPPKFTDIEDRLTEIKNNFTTNISLQEELLAFYHPDTLLEILNLRSFLLENSPISGNVDPINDWIRMVALNRLTGHSAGFFSTYTLPPNQAVSISSQLKINQRLNKVPPYKDTANLILKKTRQLLKDNIPHSNASFNLSISKAWELYYLNESSIDLVITSPPFLDIVNYKEDNWLRNWFAGINDNEIDLSQFKNVNDWLQMIHKVSHELSRVLKKGGYLVIEVGEVRGGKIKLEEYVWKALENLPFKPICVLINQQNFTKTSNCWGVGNNHKGTNTNRIVVAQKI